jgi:hypothetical protein
MFSCPGNNSLHTIQNFCSVTVDSDFHTSIRKCFKNIYIHLNTWYHVLRCPQHTQKVFARNSHVTLLKMCLQCYAWKSLYERKYTFFDFSLYRCIIIIWVVYIRIPHQILVFVSNFYIFSYLVITHYTRNKTFMKITVWEKNTHFWFFLCIGASSWYEWCISEFPIKYLYLYQIFICFHILVITHYMHTKQNFCSVAVDSDFYMSIKNVWKTCIYIHLNTWYEWVESDMYQNNRICVYVSIIYKQMIKQSVYCYMCVCMCWLFFLWWFVQYNTKATLDIYV